MTHEERIERITNIIRATEVERDAGDKVANNLRAEIAELKSLLARAANALVNENHVWCNEGDELIQELRKAAE